MINVLAIIPNINDATSLYRGMGPLSLLRKRQDFNILMPASVTDANLDMADFVFIQRPHTAEHAKIAEMCEMNGTPLWIDYDDLLFDVPESNPAYEHFMTKEVHDQIIKCIRKATVVTVSTEQLKRCLQPPQAPLNKRVYVIENGLHDKYLHLARPYQSKKHVNWRGSKTHQEDVMAFAPEIAEVASERPDVTFTFVGDNPFFLTQHMRKQQAIIVPTMTINDYFKFMSVTNPSVQIVPLANNLFNMCKSNIAWIEGCLAGAVCIAPYWPEWTNRPGMLHYKNQEEFKQCLETALDKPTHMAQLHAEASEYIRSNLLMSQINEKRWDIMRALNELSQGFGEGFPDGGEPIKQEQEIVMELE